MIKFTHVPEFKEALADLGATIKAIFITWPCISGPSYVEMKKVGNALDIRLVLGKARIKVDARTWRVISDQGWLTFQRFKGATAIYK